MSEKTVPELDQLDRRAAERILQAISEADHQTYRVKRNLRSRVQSAITEHRNGVMQTIRPQKPEKVKVPVDYNKLIAILRQQPLTYDIIKNETGLNDSGVAEVITTLSLRCALWDPAKGIYELLPK